MLLTAYETLACRAYNTKEITSKLKLTALEDGLMNLQTTRGEHVYGVMGIRPGDDLVPPFSHPFLFMQDEKNTDPKDAMVIIDTRGLLKETANGIKMTNQMEYDFLLTRAALNKHWLTDPSDLMTLGEFPPLIFIRWLTDAMVRNLGINPSDQIKVTTICLFYWYSLFRDEDFQEKDKIRIVSKLTQLTAIPANLSMDISDKIGFMPTISSFTDTLRFQVGNPRLEKMNPGYLYSLLGGSWFGENVKEVIAVALEHPPTFIAMIARALEVPGYRKSIIGRLVYENDKRGRGDTFKKNLHSVLAQHKSK